jgi:hypothetical protein
MRPGQSVRRGGTLGTASRLDEALVAGSRKKCGGERNVKFILNGPYFCFAGIGDQEF